MALLAGGGSAQLKRDPGTAGAVQGQLAFGSALAGARLSTALPFAALFQAGDGQAQVTRGAPPPPPSSSLVAIMMANRAVGGMYV